MRRSLRFSVLALAAAAVLAGCLGADRPAVSARNVPLDAPSEGGDGDYALTVRVTGEPAGPAIHRAGVVVYWGDTIGTASGEGSLDVGGSGGVAIRGSGTAGAMRPETTIPLRTDEDGGVVARVPANRAVSVVASAAGWTEEWIAAMPTGAAGASGTIELPLYRQRVLTQLNDTWGPGGLSGGKLRSQGYEWKPNEIVWGGSPDVQDAYTKRLATLEVRVEWTNGAGGAGDLGVGVGRTPNAPDHVSDRDPDATNGARNDEARFATADIEGYAWPNAGTLFAGPTTGSAFVAPFGLAYTLTTEATFDPFADPNVEIRVGGERESPATGAALLAPLLALAAVLARRR